MHNSPTGSCGTGPRSERARRIPGWPTPSKQRRRISTAPGRCRGSQGEEPCGAGAGIHCVVDLSILAQCISEAPAQRMYMTASRKPFAHWILHVGLMLLLALATGRVMAEPVFSFS